MSKIVYDTKKFTGEHLQIINKANEFLMAYANQGLILSLRQLYYRFVATDSFPDSRRWAKVGGKYIRHPEGTKNAEPNYKWLGGIIGDARICGRIDWEHIEDRARNLLGLRHYGSVQESLNDLASSYHIDMWARQGYRPEVWVEKDALRGVIEGPCNALDVPYFSCKGYNSLSEMWRTAQRLEWWNKRSQKPIIFYFGDHDPSGIDMSRDIEERLRITFRSDFEIKRLALTMDQIEEYDPPPNPAKTTDSRYADYLELYGDESWELDALEPTVFRQLITSEIEKLKDVKQWKDDEKTIKRTQDRLKDVSKEWDSIAGYKEQIKSKELVIAIKTKEADLLRESDTANLLAIQKLQATALSLKEEIATLKNKKRKK